MKTPSKKTNSEFLHLVHVVSVVLFVIILLLPIKVHLKTSGITKDIEPNENPLQKEKVIKKRTPGNNFFLSAIENNTYPLPTLKPELTDWESEVQVDLIARAKVTPADVLTDKQKANTTKSLGNKHNGNLYKELSSSGGDLLADAEVELLIEYYGKPEPETRFSATTTSKTVSEPAPVKFVIFDFLEDELKLKNKQIQEEIELEWQLKKYGTKEKESSLAFESWMMDDICWCPDKRTKSYKEYLTSTQEEK
jgi:hypothetical protein